MITGAGLPHLVADQRVTGGFVRGSHVARCAAQVPERKERQPRWTGLGACRCRSSGSISFEIRIFMTHLHKKPCNRGAVGRYTGCLSVIA